MGTSSGLLAEVVLGVVFGVNMLHFPDISKVVSVCSEYNITTMRISEPNPLILDGFKTNKDVAFTIGIPNYALKKMNDKSAVENWFNNHLKHYIPLINIECIVVGENGHRNTLSTMKVVRDLLTANNRTKVKLSTTIKYSDLLHRDPPSKAVFHPSKKDNMHAILKYLAGQGNELMVSLYPYHKYVYDNRDMISIDYATFGKRGQVQDGPFVYHNLFDAMVDTIYVAIDKLEDEMLNNITVVIGETGWPTDGGRAYANVTFASRYNNNLVAHLRSGKGTPRRKNVNFKGFIRSLLNEDTRPEGESRYYGIFKDNFTPVYPLFKKKSH